MTFPAAQQDNMGSGEPSLPGVQDDLLNILNKRKRRATKIILSDADLKLLAIRIRQDATDGANNSLVFRANHTAFWSNWRGTPEPPSEDHPLGELAANVKTPLTTTYIEQWKARLDKIVIGDGDIAKFYSLIEGIELEQLEKVSRWFNWELMNVVKIEERLNTIDHYLLVDGFCLSMPEYITKKRVVFNSYEYDFDATVNLAAQIEQAIQKCFTDLGFTLKNMFPVDNETGVYEIDLSESDKLATVTALIEEDILVLEAEYEEILFDGVEVPIPNCEDIVVMNTDPDPEKIPFLINRSWLDAGEFDQRAKNGEFPYLDYKSAETDIMAFAGPKIPDIVPIDTTNEADVVEGADSTAAPYAISNDKNRLWIELYQWEGWIDYKGERVGVCAWVTAKADYVLNLVRLTDLNRMGRRTCIKHDFIPVPGRFYSLGLAELMQHMQTEMDGIHNFRLDSALVATVPFGFYGPTAGVPGTIIGLRPGKMYPIKDPKAVVFPNLNWNQVWGFEEESLTRKYASELAGIGDLGVGTFTSKRTSASEFVGTAQSIDTRTEHIAKNILRGVEDLFYRIFSLYQQHSKGIRTFMVAGEDGSKILESISMDSIQGKIKLQLNGSVRKLSEEIEKQKSMQMLSILMNQFAIQMGIVGPDTIYQAISKIMKDTGYKGVNIHKPNTPPDSPPPEEELTMMMAGIYPQPHMGENFGMHLQAHLMTMQLPDLDKKMSPGAIAMLQQHVQETYQMYQQVQIMQMQAAIQAESMQNQLGTMGVRPGQAGATDSSAANPGAKAEGVQGAAGDDT